MIVLTYFFTSVIIRTELRFLVTEEDRAMSNEHDPSCSTIRATVGKVIDDNYVVAYPLEDCGDLRSKDSVTFSLNRWAGYDEPEHGQTVELVNTSLYARGWRAESDRPVTPKSSNKQQGAPHGNRRI